MRLKIDYSSLALYRTCPRKFFYRYVLGHDAPEPSDALAFGTAIHEGLGDWHGNIPGNTPTHETRELCESAPEPTMCAHCHALARYKALAETLPINAINPEEKRSVQFGETLLKAYIDTYNRDPFYGFKPLVGKDGLPTVELALEAPMYEDSENTIIYNGRCDMAAELPDGRIAAIEHKTAYRVGQDFVNQIKPNDQITGYLWLISNNGYPTCRTSIWNGLQTGAPKKLIDDPASCFVRVETSRTEAEIAEWKREVIDSCMDIIRDIKREYFRRGDAPKCCTQYFSHCTFADVCNSTVDMRRRLLDGSYPLRPWKGLEITASDQKSHLPIIGAVAGGNA